MADEAATTKRTDGNVKDDEFLPVLENLTVPDAPDAAVAVNLADLRKLVEHARTTGGEDLAAKFTI